MRTPSSARYCHLSQRRAGVLVLTIALGGQGLLFDPAAADDLESTAVAEPAKPNQSKLTLSAGIDFTTAYFFRGILQERNGFIMQPYATLGFSLYEGDGLIRSWGASVNTWNSFQTDKTLASGSGPGNWYESDINVATSVGLAGGLTMGGTYTAYTYPNGAYPTVQELSLGLGFNDTEWLGAFALQPSLLFAFEVDNTALGANEGVYMQIGAKPSYTLFSDAKYPLTLGLPLNVGLSLSDYYEGPDGKDETFGFFQFGLVGSIPLAFIPPTYGSWAAAAEIDVYVLGDNLSAYNFDDDVYPVGRLGLSMAF